MKSPHRTLMVLTLAAVGLTGCEPKPPRSAYPENNEAAQLKVALPWNPREGRVLTSWVGADHTMTTLYGDDAAINYARGHADGNYPAGAKLGAITWAQTDDARWFGGRIPAEPVRVELVTAGAGYQRYEGKPLAAVAASDAQDREAFLLSQRAAVMP